MSPIKKVLSPTIIVVISNDNDNDNDNDSHSVLMLAGVGESNYHQTICNVLYVYNL